LRFRYKDEGLSHHVSPSPRPCNSTEGRPELYDLIDAYRRGELEPEDVILGELPVGLVDFDRIHDARNAAPTIRTWTPPQPTPYLSVGVHVEIPDVLEPRILAFDFRGSQPFKLVIFGEKTSLEPVVGPIAERYEADLYLPSGDISDTLLHQMAKTGAADGRPMVVVTLSDSDPSGWNMPVVIAHKLRAFRDLLYPALSFEVRRVALTPDQRPRSSIGTLARRVAEAEYEWLTQAQAALADQLDPQERARITSEAQAKLDELRAEVAAINDAVRVDVDPDSLPEIIIPLAVATIVPALRDRRQPARIGRSSECRPER
jgi:hypothetical protein